ncbi:uncharacterized protein LOC127855780 isoform X2 [Dreissena polymorpha]|uniref:uncharacterized protein LOC127855780 isoform X2 n=1 Tax=Dreissena polymorpha TaxID=45954 RepID=UPI0022650111|nr:uncharacterized protein LOC127855780 isoform X2 [Dreissena polymorpha]
MAGSNVTVAPTIGEWSAAVFYATSKKWVCGRLSVTAQLVNFVPCVSKQTSSGTSNPGSSTIAHKFQPDSASQSQTRTIQMNQSELLSLKISHPQKVVSDNEAEEISSALKNMKSLALAIQEEQTSQNAKLDSILSDVDVANQRLKNTSGKIEKLA